MRIAELLWEKSTIDHDVKAAIGDRIAELGDTIPADPAEIVLKDKAQKNIVKQGELPLRQADQVVLRVLTKQQMKSFEALLGRSK